MKRIDLIKAVEANGCEFVRHGGKHDWYRNPATGLSHRFPAIGRSPITLPAASSAC